MVIETSQLRCFVAVAEELHFGRAAARLNMTQPPLSRQIQLLERALGCQLFVRTSRSVQLTQAGSSLLADAHKVLRLLESAAVSVRHVSEGRKGDIRCGFTAASAYQFLPMLVRRLGQTMPGVNLSLKEMVSRRQIEALESAELDIAILRPPIDHDKFESVCVSREQMILALPRNHPLCDKAKIAWTDLDTLDLIMYDSHEAQYFYDLLAGQFARHGVFPKFRQRLTQIHTILSLVRSEIGAAIVPESASILDVAEIQYRHIEARRPLMAELYFVWRRDTRNPLVAQLVALAGTKTA
ncbi:MAG TPA: LysR family transcriptional regulator [Devosiaceae bacterium]|nr:LysR family transcriptional regulator [Devosiaceae bacterium]